MEEDSNSSKSIHRFEAEAAQAEAKLHECRTQRQQLNDEIRSLNKSIKVLEVNMPKLQLEIDGCDTTRENLSRRIPELRSQCVLSDTDRARKEELDRKVDRCKAEMSSCDEQVAAIQGEVDQLQKAILDAGGSRLKKQQKLCEQALSALGQVEKELKAAHVSIKSSEKAASKAASSKEALAQQLQDCEQAKAVKEEELNSLEEDALRVRDAYDAVKAIEAEKKESLELVSKESGALKKAQSEIKCLEVELLGSIDALEKQIHEASKKCRHWQNELNNLRATAADEEVDLDLSDDEGEEDDDKVVLERDEIIEDHMDVETDLAKDSSSAENEPPMDPKESPSLPVFSPAMLEKYDKEKIKAEISMLETERNTIAKNANMGAIAEYRKKEADYLARYVRSSYWLLVRPRCQRRFLTHLFSFPVLSSWMQSPKSEAQCEKLLKTSAVSAWRCSWTDLVRLR
jgi:structural maintenance of chromosome 4